jgi:ribosomal protein S27AE
MGIERKELVQWHYTCDRCGYTEQHMATFENPSANPEGWTDIKTLTFDERYIPRSDNQTLCPSCKTEFMAWFKDVA